MRGYGCLGEGWGLCEGRGVGVRVGVHAKIGVSGLRSGCRFEGRGLCEGRCVRARVGVVVGKLSIVTFSHI